VRHFQALSQNCEKRLKSLVISVRLSACVEKLGSHWKDFREILYLIIFKKFAEKFQFSLKSDKNSGYFARRPTYILDHISLSS
jgi:hypothetical protein